MSSSGARSVQDVQNWAEIFRIELDMTRSCRFGSLYKNLKYVSLMKIEIDSV